MSTRQAGAYREICVGDCIQIRVIHNLLENPVLRIRIRLDPFHFGRRIRIRVAKISQNHGNFPQKSTKIIRILYIKKNNKLMFKGHKYLPHK